MDSSSGRPLVYANEQQESDVIRPSADPAIRSAVRVCAGPSDWSVIEHGQPVG